MCLHVKDCCVCCTEKGEGVRRRQIHSHSFRGEIQSLEMEKHFGKVSTVSKCKV